MLFNFGNIISQKDFQPENLDGKFIKEFNEKLQSQLEGLVHEIDASDKEKLKKYFYIKQSLFKKILFIIPAIIGFIINAPLYFIIHLIIKKSAEDHYDSIVTALLFLFYPLFTLIIALIIFFITKSSYSFLLLILLPFTLWSYLQLKRQIRN
jgi:hypothetical protein